MTRRATLWPREKLAVPGRGRTELPQSAALFARSGLADVMIVIRPAEKVVERDTQIIITTMAPFTHTRDPKHWPQLTLHKVGTRSTLETFLGHKCGEIWARDVD